MTAESHPVPAQPTTSRKRRLAIRSAIVLVLVAPLLVAAAWMWSMWDPSHYLSDVKIAVVNEDQGTKQEGKEVNFGKDVVDGLLNTDYLNVESVSPEEADHGMKSGDYIVTLSIPKNFSADVATVIDPKPRQAQVIISYNDHYGTNTPLLTSGLVPGIQEGIQEGITTGYSSQILDGMNQLSKGLKEAADGSVQLDDGAKQLKDGTTQGIDGAKQLKDGTSQLRDGSSQLKDGTVQLDNGLTQLLDGTRQLGDGSAQIDDGVGQLTGSLIPLLRQVGTATEQLKPIIDTLERLGLHEQAQQIRKNIALLDNNNPQGMANQLQKLKDGTAEMRYNLNNPQAPYLSGVLQLKDGSTQLRDGATQLNDGAVQLDDGMGQMLDGTYQLDDGVRQLKDGTTQLREGLTEGAKQAPQITDITASSHQMAVPVAYSQDYRHPVQTLEDLKDPTSKQLSGGVTFILILVFGFLFMALVSMLAPHILGKRRRTSVVAKVLGGFSIVAVVNLGILALLTWAGSSLGFDIQNPAAFFFVLVLLAAHGTAVFQLLRIAFGRLVGGTLALGYFAYGVFCFGGVWPIQLTPKPLRLLHDVHTMTYARDAFVGAVENNLDGSFSLAIVVLLVTTGLSLVLSVIARKRIERKQAALAEQEDQDLLVSA